MYLITKICIRYTQKVTPESQLKTFPSLDPAVIVFSITCFAKTKIATAKTKQGKALYPYVILLRAPLSDDAIMVWKYLNVAPRIPNIYITILTGNLSSVL